MDLNPLTYSSRRYFLVAMQVFFGIWLLYAGVTKFVMMGASGFVGFITTEFDKTWSPHALNVALAWLILIAEPVLALLILSGFKRRLVWTMTALLMFLLTMGQSILMKPEVIANWEYLVLTVVCAALSEPEGKSEASV